MLIRLVTSAVLAAGTATYAFAAPMSADDKAALRQQCTGDFTAFCGDMPPEDGPETMLEEDQFREALAEAIASLPERERLVLSLYYDQELNLREIGAILEVSESRVCQIHGQAVLRVRARLDRWFNDE